jgi:hypothetical protein
MTLVFEYDQEKNVEVSNGKKLSLQDQKRKSVDQNVTNQFTRCEKE